MDVFQNMELFSELIQCGGNIYTWCYNADGSLLQSNCPEAGFLSGAFDLFGCKKKMLDYGSRHTTPPVTKIYFVAIIHPPCRRMPNNSARHIPKNYPFHYTSKKTAFAIWRAYFLY